MALTLPMADAVPNAVASSAEYNRLRDNVLDLDARIGAAVSGSPLHTRVNTLESRTTDTVTSPGGIGNQRLADRLGTGVGTGTNVTTGAAMYQFADLRTRVTTLEGSATVDTAGRIVARGHRATSSTGSTGTETGVIRVSAALVINRVYTIEFPIHVLDSTAGNDGTASIRVRYNTSPPATTSSTIVPGSTYFGQEGREGKGFCTFTAASTATHSFLLCVARSAGTGTLSLFADGDRLIELVIRDAGVDPGDTGVDI